MAYTSAGGQSDYYAAMVMAASNYDAGSTGPGMYGGYSYCYGTGPAAPHAAQQHTYSAPQPAPQCGSLPYVTVGGPNTSTSSAGSSRLAPGSVAAPGKRYRHNPYASEPSTPTSLNATLSANSSLNGSVDSPSFQQLPSPYSPMYTAEGGAAAGYTEGSYPAMSNVTEQFYGMVGSIAHSACTVRGRHLLISVLRLQHVDKIQIIFEEVLPQVNLLMLDPQGCHVLRTLIEFVSEEQLSALVSYLEEPTILAMATASQHTRRALQTLFERHRTNAFDFIVQVIAADAMRLAMTQQGCIAIMRMIEHALPHQKQHLVAALIPSLPTLTMDPYGNYVVQCILQNFDANLTASVVCDAFSGHWVPLSCNKFASNVMEKVVRLMTGSARSALVRELVFETSNLLCLMQDGFGNFVLQAVIDSSADPVEFRSIADAVRPQLHTSPYGHKIDGKLKSKRFNRSGSQTHDSGYSSSSN